MSLYQADLLMPIEREFITMLITLRLIDPRVDDVASYIGPLGISISVYSWMGGGMDAYMVDYSWLENKM